MKIIGLTGGIGSGKSTVARFLAELGAAVIDLDKIGHEVQKPHSAVWQQFVSAFGKEILTPSGEIDRVKLGAIVFKNREALMRLNNIIHPAIDGIVAEKINEFRRKGFKVAVLEAAAMIDAGKTDLVEELWVTVAPESVVVKRLHKRSGYSETDSRTRINAQLKNEERLKKAAVIFQTDCTLDELKSRVLIEWQKLQKRL
jgi:dephospho-CoA kinase